MDGKIVHVHPAEGGELPAGPSQVRFRCRRTLQGAEEVDLLLPVETAPVRAGRKVVAVRTAPRGHSVGIGGDSHLLIHFPAERVLR